MKARNWFYLFVFLLLVATACKMDSGDGIYISSTTFDFNNGEQGWQHGFSDYPAGEDDSVFYELKYAYTKTPPDLPGESKAIMLSGNNHSDDLFMFLKKKLTGLKPNAYYTLTFNVEFASNAPAGSVGAGGSPGESVYLKVGATSIEPKSLIENGNFVMNIDKGNQSQNGNDMVSIGNIATPPQNQNSQPYSLLVRSNTAMNYSSPEVRSNNNGELWIIVGTDSGFEGTTTLYYTRINVVLSFKN